MNYFTIPGIKRTPEVIISAIAEKNGTTWDALKGKAHHRKSTYLRHIAWHYIRAEHGLSTEKLGRLFNRDHTTVIHGLKKFDDLVNTNCKDFKELIQKSGFELNK